MTTALLAEDEPLLAQALRAELARAWPALQVVAMVGDGHAAAAQTLALAPDLCFFDIRMPGQSGLEAAEALAEDWPTGPGAAPFPLLVFVTAYDQYAVQAFDRAAVDYLVKPVQPARLAQCVSRLQQRLAERGVPPRAPGQGDAPPRAHPERAGPTDGPAIAADEALARALEPLRRLLVGGAGAPTTPPAAPAPLEVITAGTGALVHLVPVDDVIYLEADDKYVRLVTAEGEHWVRMSLRELLPRLDARRFWQVHRSLVVQARCIATARREDSGKVTLTLRQRPETLTASRLYAHLFKAL